MMMKNYDESVEINPSPNWPCISYHPYIILIIALHEKCPNSEIFWSAFFCIRTGYREIRNISPSSVQMLENADQNNSKYGHFLRNLGCSVSGKSNALLSLVKYQLPDIDKIHLYVKDPFKVSVTYQRKKIGIKKLELSKACIDYSQTIDYVCENLEEFNPTKKRKVLVVFDDMMTEMKTY